MATSEFPSSELADRRCLRSKKHQRDSTHLKGLRCNCRAAHDLIHAIRAISVCRETIMIDISVLYGGLETPSTPHRYGRKITQIDPPEHQRMEVAKSAAQRRPIVVWNLTRTCNLKCVHCYTSSEAKRYPNELATEQCKVVLEDLA